METSTTTEEEWSDPDGLLDLLYDFRYGEAESLLKLSILEGETAHLYHRLGHVLLAQNRHEEAREQYKRAAELCPSESAYPRAVKTLLELLLYKIQHAACRYNARLLLRKARKQGFFDRSVEAEQKDVWPPAPKGG